MDLAVIICPLVAFLLYYDTLQAGFVYDDKRAILENADVTVASESSTMSALMVHDFWGTPLNASESHGSYRPLVTLSFRWTAHLVGVNHAYWYHWTNVLLHCVITAAVTMIAGGASTLFLQENKNKNELRHGNYVTGLLFAAHPIHCEAVAGLVGRADLLCTFFVLAGLVNYGRRASLTMTLVLTCAAFFSKEYGIMLTPICLLYDVVLVIHGHPRQSKRNNRMLFKRAILVLWSVALVAYRFWISGFQRPQFAKADNPTAASSSWTTRTLTFLYLPVFHFGLLLYPRWLSFDWSMDAIQPVTCINDIRNMATLIFYAILVTVVRKTVEQQSQNKTQKILVALAILITTIPFLPATNVFAYVGFVAAERILYLPSVGFCLLVGIGVQKLLVQQSNRTIICFALLIVLLASGRRTIQRNNDWIDEEHLYRSGIEINPPKAYGNLGVVLQESGRLTEAEWNFKKALSYRPNMADVHHNLGNLFQQQGRYEESLQAYNLAILHRPQLAAAYSQKAKVLYKLKRWAEAERTLLACTQLTGHLQKDPNAHQSAKVSATILMADLLSQNASRVNEAEDWLLRARKLAPRNPLVYFQLGEFLSARKRHDEAAEVYIQVVRIEPDSIAWTVAAAHALHDASRNVEAEVYFRRAVALVPMDISHRINLGAVLHVQGKFHEAEQVYLKALHLSPNHPLTTANLRRLRNSWNTSHQSRSNNQSFT
ncbi:protein O-mannosyl-transferase TMTC2-like isoform X2 [Daphnia magna]|uniref:protein O-mannosyl-transferase TMTC2-like isoform X2 n=1 Tax=Daphnia magna TaxID=35525 RepID=UPI001E1BB6FA|nr:protein O-mannosyl-transferase TMTC2-like isoform X2 [Daphnia magna]